MPDVSHTLQLVCRHQYVAINHQHPVVVARLPSLYEIVELRIGARRRVADQEFGVNLWMFCNEASYERDDRIVGIGHAKQNFVARMVERKGGLERLLDEIFDPADRT